MDQVEVNVAQVQLSQAVEGSLQGPLPLILRAQLTAGQRGGLLRIVHIAVLFRYIISLDASPGYEHILSG